jgi:DNA-binding transcriptional regulator YiaG
VIKTVNATEVKVVLVRNGKTKEQLAKELGVTSRTLQNWLSKGVMPSTAIEYMMKHYEIENPERVFFSEQKVT